MGMKDDDLAGLSDEERAALAEDDGEAEILQGIAGDDEAGDQEGDDDSADDEGAGADSGDASGAEDASQAAGADDSGEAGESAVQDEFRPLFKAEIPDGMADKLAILGERSTELMQKFKDGVIELPEFMEQKEAIDQERLQLRLAEEQSRWAQQQNDSSQAQRWQWEQERFFGQEKAKVYDDPILFAALNASVIKLRQDPGNEKRLGWLLEEADRQVRERFRMASEPEQNLPAKTKPRQPDLTKVPKTLATLPAAEIPDSGTEEFSHLDKLAETDPMAYERALAKLTPEQETRYLGAAA